MSSVSLSSPVYGETSLITYVNKAMMKKHILLTSSGLVTTNTKNASLDDLSSLLNTAKAKLIDFLFANPEQFIPNYSARNIASMLNRIEMECEPVASFFCRTPAGFFFRLVDQEGVIEFTVFNSI